MTMITTTAELARFCASLEGAAFVAVDTEFMRESTYWPKLCLVQAATEAVEAVIDPLAPGIDLEPFLDVMRDGAILKVFHAARQDVEILYNLKAMPAPLFDTQVAGMAAGFPEQVAYDVLVRRMLQAEVDKSSRFTDWARRPLSGAQLTYALADVTHLAKLYPILRARLEESGRLGWVMEEMAALLDPALYDTDPEKAWKRLKPRRHSAKYLCILRALAAWRERMAQTRDQPRGRVLKDDAIDELATQAPTDVAALDRLRSLPKGFSGSRYAADVLGVVRQGLEAAEHHPPEAKRVVKSDSAPTGAVIELLKVLLKARSEDANVASKLIATVGDLERIAANDQADTPALHGWRREAFGEDALKLKRGEIALMLDAGKVRVVEVRRRPRVDET